MNCEGKQTMDGVENSGHVPRTPRKARDIKRKSKNKRKAEPQDVNELTTLFFLFLVFIINWENRLCSSERFRFTLIELKHGAALIR